MTRATEDSEILHAALIGYERELARIDSRIAEIRRLLGNHAPVASGATNNAAKRVLSGAGRRRIAAAQKKRWAEFRKAKAALKKPAGGKRPKKAGSRKPAARAMAAKA